MAIKVLCAGQFFIGGGGFIKGQSRSTSYVTFLFPGQKQNTFTMTNSESDQPTNSELVVSVAFL